MPHFPIFLNLHGRLAIVVGGGLVGQRRAKALIEAGARVRVIDPRPAPPDWESEWIAEAYGPHQLNDAHLVIAAATSDVNEHVVRDARAKNIWVSSASNPVTGDFVFPAVRRHGRITIAATTGGASPTLSRQIAEQAIDSVSPLTASLVDIFAELREKLLRSLSPGEFMRLLNDLGDRSWKDRAQRLSADELRSALRAAIELAIQQSSNHVEPG